MIPLMAPTSQRRVVQSVVVGIAGVVGVAFAAWGLWVLYTGIANVDPQSEIPRWVAFALGSAVLLVGVWLLLLVRSARRRLKARDSL
jgi:L-lactate permease